MSSMRCTFVKTIKEEKGDNVVQTKYLCKWDNQSLNQHDIIPEVYQLHTTKDRTRRTPTTTYKNTIRSNEFKKDLFYRNAFN